MTNETVKTTNKKFFFDQNIFDEDGNIITDHLVDEDLPPTYSQEELDAAQKQSFQDGHRQATEAEKNSREQRIAALMETLSINLSMLCQQEAAREKLYEREVSTLTLTIFQKLFPFYNKQHGFNELSSALQDIIQAHSGQQTILINVPPDLTDDIDTFLQKVRIQTPSVFLEVQGDESLTGTNCALSWKNGGALHNTETIAEEILGILKDRVAASDANRHDKEDVQHVTASGPSEEPGSENSSDHPALKEKSDE